MDVYKRLSTVDEFLPLAKRERYVMTFRGALDGAAGKAATAICIRMLVYSDIQVQHQWHVSMCKGSRIEYKHRRIATTIGRFLPCRAVVLPAHAAVPAPQHLDDTSSADARARDRNKKGVASSMGTARNISRGLPFPEQPCCSASAPICLKATLLESSHHAGCT